MRVSRRSESRVTRLWSPLLSAVALSCTSCLLPAQPLTVTPRGSVAVDATTTDQDGVTFAVAGLSGISRIDDSHFVAVMDNSNKLVFYTITFAADGSIMSAVTTGGLSLAETRDFEGIAYTTAERNSVYLSDEGAPGVHEYGLANGRLLQSLDVPTVYASRRENFGFESLARSSGGQELWTANEEALSVDGPISTPTNGTLVRLLRFRNAGGAAYTPAEQYVYLTEPMHGPQIDGGRSGVSDMVLLPDRRMLVLERSLAFRLTGLFEDRIYVVDLGGATDVSDRPSLVGASYTRASKTLLWRGSVMNMEGLALGPRLANGNYALVGVVDDGDPVSTNRLVAFELAGVGPDPCVSVMPGDSNCDGVIDNSDIEAFVLALLDAESWEAQATCDFLCANDMNLDDLVDASDIDGFVQALVGG